MAKLDRYILSQLTGPFAVFALILVGVYWVGRAVGLFDHLIGDGQSVGVFFELMILLLPQIVTVVLPIVAFAAALFVSNRLHSDSEMVVLQSTGFSPFRLLRPFMIFGLLAAILAGTLVHYLVPVSVVRLDQRLREVAEDTAARLIVGGQFLHPSDDVTFFVRDVSDEGGLLDVFLYDQRGDGRDITYSAHKAILYRTNDDARLVMFDGLIQTFDEHELLLTKIQFDEFVFDIGTLTGKPDARARGFREFSTLASLFPTASMLAETGATAADFKLEAHKRIEQPILTFTYPLIGMAVLMLGSFSRFGVFRQMVAALIVVVFLGILAVPLREYAQSDIRFWPLVYVPDALGLFIVWAMLKSSSGRRTKAGKVSA